MPTAVLINGPIASGKTTVGRALQALVPKSALIDGDDHGAPAEISLSARWTFALWRIDGAVRDALQAGRNAIVAWPLTPLHFEHLRDTAHECGAIVFCATLCPPIEIVLTGRGRTLTPWERERIAAMYAEGYAARRFSDVLIDTATTDAATNAQEILRAMTTTR